MEKKRRLTSYQAWERDHLRGLSTTRATDASAIASRFAGSLGVGAVGCAWAAGVVCGAGAVTGLGVAAGVSLAAGWACVSGAGAGCGGDASACADGGALTAGAGGTAAGCTGGTTLAVGAGGETSGCAGGVAPSVTAAGSVEAGGLSMAFLVRGPRSSPIKMLFRRRRERLASLRPVVATVVAAVIKLLRTPA